LPEGDPADGLLDDVDQRSLPIKRKEKPGRRRTKA